MLDLSRTLEQIENLKKNRENQTKQKTTTSSIAITEIDQESDPTLKDVIVIVTTINNPRILPFMCP